MFLLVLFRFQDYTIYTCENDFFKNLIESEFE